MNYRCNDGTRITVEYAVNEDHEILKGKWKVEVLTNDGCIDCVMNMAAIKKVFNVHNGIDIGETIICQIDERSLVVMDMYT